MPVSTIKELKARTAKNKSLRAKYKKKFGREAPFCGPWDLEWNMGLMEKALKSGKELSYLPEGFVT